MKRLLTLALAIVPLLSMAQDDMYFTPSKKDKVKKETVRLESSVTNAPRPEVVDYHSNRRSDDDYNRRYSYSGDRQNAGGADVDSTYAGDYDMEDPEIDYRFSRRLIRFHSPRYYALTSPYYWDLMYSYGAWDYLYDPYDPWYWSYGWGYGWSWGPWDCWYGGIWGYHHYNHWAYWGWGPGWGHYHGFGGHYVGNSYRPRGEFAQTGRGNGRIGGTALRTNPAASLGSRGSGVSYRSSANSGSHGMLSTAGSQRSSQRTGVSNPYGTRGSQGLGASRTSADRYNNRSSAVNSRVTPSRSSVNAGSSSRQSTSSRTSGTTYTPSRSTSTSSRTSSSSYTPSRSSSTSSFGGGGSSRGGGGGFSGGGGSRGSGGGRR